MLPLSDAKLFVVTVPINNSVDSTSFTTNEIDTVGFDYVTIIGHLGATDGPMTAWKVQESDTTAPASPMSPASLPRAPPAMAGCHRRPMTDCSSGSAPRS